MRPALVLTSLATLLLAACASTAPRPTAITANEPFNPGSIWEQIPAQIRLVRGDGSFEQEIRAPTRVALGQPVDVWVTTYWGGCIHPGSGQIRVDGLQADVQVFDFRLRQLAPSGDPERDKLDLVCLTYLRVAPRLFQVRFEQRGDAVIRVHGEGRDVLSPTPTPEVVELRVQVL